MGFLLDENFRKFATSEIKTESCAIFSFYEKHILLVSYFCLYISPTEILANFCYIVSIIKL